MIKPYFFISLATAFFALSTSNVSAAAVIEMPEVSPSEITIEGVPESIKDHLHRATSAFELLSTVNSLQHMEPKDLKTLSTNIGVKNKEKLESILPSEVTQAATVTSCCLPFFQSCLKISGKALGGLAINLLLDIADGKLDGHGPTGEIKYVDDLIQVVHTEIQALNAAKA